MRKKIQVTTRASEEPRSGSQQRVDGRRDGACEQERWRVDEWCQRRECWWVIGHHETYRGAEKQLEYCMKNCAGEERRWRVVWLRERVQLQSHKSPIGGGSAVAPESSEGSSAAPARSEAARDRKGNL